jgi:hypothetical protein
MAMQVADSGGGGVGSRRSQCGRMNGGGGEKKRKINKLIKTDMWVLYIGETIGDLLEHLPQ